jgi:uncharacterized protein with ParB-like and HNH nuclease domain
MDNINLITIHELIDGKIDKKEVIIKDKDLPFFVDSYQRGYKWGEKEIHELLNDVNNFNDPSEFYCLQPLVIKQIDNKYELIDGQQRCTTLFLILNYLQKETFKIEYNVRKSSQAFLEKKHFMEEWNVSNKEFNNIDNYHFSQAYQSIIKWFSDKEESKNDFKKKLLEKVKVIWYKVNNSESSQQIFKRINIGKIPLTNADLVKAILAINCKDENILNQWNEVELKLKNDQFWWFISNTHYSNRIDYLLEIITKTANDTNNLASFISFEKAENKKELWDKTYKLFLKLVDFEEEIEMYHKLGFAIWRLKYSLDSIIEKGKNDILNELENSFESLKSKLRNKIPENNNLVDASFHYGEDHDSVYDILFLHNLETHYNICSKQYYNPFPFKEFKNTFWSLEHISPQNIETLKKDELLKFAENLKSINLKDDDFLTILISRLENEQLSDEDFSKIKEGFEKDLIDRNIELISEKERHAIVNLCLIDKNLNSSLSNNFLHKKREIICNIESFVPICSMQIFNKHFTPKPKEFTFWNEEDRKNYGKTLLNLLNS